MWFYVCALLLDVWEKGSLMVAYHIEIQNVVNTALAELALQHQQGLLVDAPISNNHYIVHWVTKALKTQRFDRCVKEDLNRWQKMGRSQGSQSELLTTFRAISTYYQSFFSRFGERKEIRDSDIEAFLDLLERMGWSVSTSEVLINVGKVQIFTDGQNSLAMCAEQCDSCFGADPTSNRGEERLIKPMNWFVRGQHAEFIQLAAQNGFMLHKRTDYKSVVKYHGEYVIYPANHGLQLAEIPKDF